MKSKTKLPAEPDSVGVTVTAEDLRGKKRGRQTRKYWNICWKTSSATTDVYIHGKDREQAELRWTGKKTPGSSKNNPGIKKPST